jgi:hypothetical protein
MRIFGCIAHAKVPDSMRGKLDAKGTRCIFLGYCEGTKAYRLMCLDTQKIIKSRDVEFLEHKSASGKSEICPSGSSGVFVDTSPIPAINKQEDEEDHSQSEDDGKVYRSSTRILRTCFKRRTRTCYRSIDHTIVP